VASTVAPLEPPATSTLPFDSNVAVCRLRAPLGTVAATHVPALGEYSSAVFRLAPAVIPPMTRTFPLVVVLELVASCVAVCWNRPPLMLPVAAHVPVVRSKSSAVVSPLELVGPVRPPATSTLPVDRSVAVCSCREAVIEPVVVQRGSSTAG